MNEVSLFSGAGGGLLATKWLLGWTTIGYVEFNDYCQRVLAQRIRDGLLDDAPIFGNIETFISEGYAEAYQGMVDVITAGFPCQPFSLGDGKIRKKEKDSRNKWPETIESICIIRPQYVVLENVTGLLSVDYIRRIFGDLAESGFDCAWRCLSAAEMEAPHFRDRIWIVAKRQDVAHPRCHDGGKGFNPTPQVSFGKRWPQNISKRYGKSKIWDEKTEARIARTPYVLANRVDRLAAIGNGQIPAVAAKAWKILTST
jgi:DNA (cytosine-5)-methyltransferase 1